MLAFVLTALLSLVAQAAPEASALIVFVTAALGVPAVSSFIAAVLRRLAGYGLEPRVAVYGASLFLTGLLVVTGAADLPPALTDDPTTTVAAYLTWLTVNAELARRLYEMLLQYLPGFGAPVNPDEISPL